MSAEQKRPDPPDICLEIATVSTHSKPTTLTIRPDRFHRPQGLYLAPL